MKRKIADRCTIDVTLSNGERVCGRWNGVVYETAGGLRVYVDDKKYTVNERDVTLLKNVASGQLHRVDANGGGEKPRIDASDGALTDEQRRYVAKIVRALEALPVDVGIRVVGAYLSKTAGALAALLSVNEVFGDGAREQVINDDDIPF